MGYMNVLTMYMEPSVLSGEECQPFSMTLSLSQKCWGWVIAWI